MEQELNDMIAELMDARVQSIRRAFQTDHKTTEDEITHVEQILELLPDHDRDWLDQYLSQQTQPTEKECLKLYTTGIKDGLRLLNLF